MDILGIGFPELVFIFIIALMVFGPRRLPEIAGKAGRFVRDLRNMSQGFLAEWQREITVATRLEEIEEVRKEFEETKQSLRQTQTEIAGGTAQIGKSLNAAITPPKTTPAPNSAPKSAELAPDTPETSEKIDSPEPTSATPAPVEAGELSTATPELKENSEAANSPDPASTTTFVETVEIIPETSEVEKNGAVSKSIPSAVAPTEVAE